MTMMIEKSRQRGEGGFVDDVDDDGEDDNDDDDDDDADVAKSERHQR